MKDDPDPNLSWLYQSEILTNPWLIFTGKASILIAFLLLTALTTAFESYLENQSVKKFKSNNSNSLDLHKLRNSIFILQFLVKTVVAITAAQIVRDVANITNPHFFYGLVLVFTFLMLVTGNWVVVFLPKIKSFEKNPLVENTLMVLMVIFTPFVRLMDFLKKFSKEKLKSKGYLPKELKQATNNENNLSKASEILSNLSVKQIMRSRLDITAFNIDQKFDELLANINEAGFSRVPVYRETIDKIEGILYIKDILPYISRGQEFTWQNLLRPAYFVPENKKIGEVLRDFQEKHVHVALVVDGYGGISGLVTMEDILEEIVGEINDELDEVDLSFIKLGHNHFIFDAKISLNDFCKTMGIEPEVFESIKGESESLAGLILQMNSNLPKKGDKIFYGNFVFRIDSASNKRIKKVKVKLLEEKEANQDAEV